uniref:Uncharacterized protein n=1 Tax=Avena sativa TaxID=4498 RepID=A0ACD5WK37_AVESA
MVLSRILAMAVLAALIGGVMCTSVDLTVEKGSDAKKLVLKIKYTRAGDSLAEVELRQHGSEDWEPFTKKGDLWEVKSSKPLSGPMNFRFLSKGGMKNVYDEVIPTAFKVGKTYTPEY